MIEDMKNYYNSASSRIAQRRRTRKFFWKFLIIFLAIIFFAGAVFLLRANFSQIKNFEISGAEAIPPEEVVKSASNFISGNGLLVIPRSNIFLLNKEKLANEILRSFPRIQSAEIEKNFFRRSISISISERKADFLWCSYSNECFFMSQSGLIFEKISDPNFDLNSKMIFRGKIEGDPLMKNFASPESMKGFSDFIKILGNNGIQTSEINFESVDKAVAETGSGKIFFNPDETDLTASATNAALLLKEVLDKNPETRFEYIDTRFGNKIFYKLI